jgi:hypothetical protein
MIRMRFDSEEQLIAALDPGIRRTVAWLRGHGFDTTDSGDGVTKFATGAMEPEDLCDVPHVVMVTTLEALFPEANRLRNLLHEARGGAVWESFAGEIDATCIRPAGINMIVLSGLNDLTLFGDVDGEAERG